MHVRTGLLNQYKHAADVKHPLTHSRWDLLNAKVGSSIWQTLFSAKSANKYRHIRDTQYFAARAHWRVKTRARK
jgi:hypothetical protein